MKDVRMMKSPITGGPIRLVWEWREMEFRNETFRVRFPYYLCVESGEQFTTTESDRVWYAQVINLYCKKHEIPYRDDIIALKERYGLPASNTSASKKAFLDSVESVREAVLRADDQKSM